jgi:hypothetical protein
MQLIEQFQKAFVRSIEDMEIGLQTHKGNTSWEYDNLEDFFEEYNKKPDSASLHLTFTT